MNSCNGKRSSDLNSGQYQEDLMCAHKQQQQKQRQQQIESTTVTK